MFKLRRLLNLALALALPLLPLWHSWEHAEDAHASRPVCVDEGAGQQHWHEASAVPAPCDACQALSQHSYGPVAQALPQPELGLNARSAQALAEPASFEFVYFDHRGPPQQV